MELVLDMETKDPYIEEGLGSGWPFYKEGRLQILCAAYKVDQQQEEVTEDMSLLLDLVSKASTIICHNVNYDVGLLHALGADYSEAIIVDTIQLAKLNNNNLFDYSLDTLSKEFFNEGKTSDKLGAIAVELGLVKTKAQNPNTVAMRNTDLIYKHDPVTVQMYAKQDVALTRRLYDKLKNVDVDLKFYSDLNKAVIAARAEGVRVDLKRAHEVEQLLTEKMKELEYVIEDLAPGVNVNSSKQLAEYFTGQGVEFPSTEKGNPSITKEFLATCPHPIAQAINKFKKYEKAVRDFTEPVIRGGRDRVYPELKIFGAAATGRMSCACVPMNTSALTRDGWKSYEELVVGEDVLAYDLESGTKKWTPLLAKNKYKDQEVGSMGTDVRKVRCTANHTWVHKGHGSHGATYKLRRADEFQLNDGYLVNAPYEADGSFDIPEFNSINKYQTSLISAITRFSMQGLRKFVLGFLLADGHFLNATKIGTKQTWQFTQVHGKILEELVIATYLSHSGRIGITNHHTHKNPNHRMTSRAVLCHSPHSTIRHVWKPESIEDVWCPTTKYGTWVMRQGDVITITGNSPNIQQIPKRDEEIGPLVRSIYLPEEGEKWYSLDFSSQEPRVQIHFASLLNAPKIDELVNAFKIDPKYDMHKWTASLIFGVSAEGVSKAQRDQAKTINLGLAYGMGVAKLANSLQISVAHAQNLLSTYHAQVPFMKYMTTICASAIRKRGYLKTLGGRTIRDDGFSHKALNKLVQGCLRGDTKILTKDGLTDIQDVVNSVVDLWDGSEFVTGSCIASGLKEEVIVSMMDGSELVCSPDHRLLTINTDGVQRWKKVSEIVDIRNTLIATTCPLQNISNRRDVAEYGCGLSGDTNSGLSNYKHRSLNQIPDSEALGELLGRVASDGSVGPNKNITLIIADHEKEITDRLLGILPTEWHYYKSKLRRGVVRYTIASVELARQMTALGIKSKVPSIAWTDKDLMRGYLRGMFDGDGTVSTEGVVILTFGKQEHKLIWAKEIQLALRMFGISSRVRHYKNDRTVVQVIRNHSSLFKTEIGFMKESKNSRLLSQATRIHRPGTRIKSITYTGRMVEMYDICDTKNERFMANGYIVHNSSCDQTYACMVEMYRRGIKFKFPIHDSIEISAKDAILIKEVKDIMENTVKLVVPSLTDVECGDTWGSLEKVSL